MKKKSILSFIIFLIIYSCSQKKEQSENSQKKELSEKTQTIVNSIIEYGEITGSAIGVGGIRPKQWDNFITLKNIINHQEIVILTQHPNSVVKCYAYDILIENKDKNKFDILKQNLKDSNFVSTQYGCIEDKIRVNDYFIESFFRQNQEKENISKSDEKILDSLIIFTPNLVCNYKDELLEYIKPKQNDYNRIKELALKENGYAIIALSKYQKENDIILINKILLDKNTENQKKGLLALKNFPNNLSFEIIKKIHSREIKRQKNYKSISYELYQSIVSFKSKESRKLLEKTINKSNPSLRKEHFKFIWLALKKNPDKVYNGIIKQLNYTKRDIKKLKNRWKSHF